MPGSGIIAPKALSSPGLAAAITRCSPGGMSLRCVVKSGARNGPFPTISNVKTEDSAGPTSAGSLPRSLRRPTSNVPKPSARCTRPGRHESDEDPEMRFAGPCSAALGVRPRVRGDDPAPRRQSISFDSGTSPGFCFRRSCSGRESTTLPNQRSEYPFSCGRPRSSLT